MKTWLPNNKEIKEWPLGDEVYELVNWPIRHSELTGEFEKPSDVRKLWDDLKRTLNEVSKDQPNKADKFGRL